MDAAQQRAPFGVGGRVDRAERARERVNGPQAFQAEVRIEGEGAAPLQPHLRGQHAQEPPEPGQRVGSRRHGQREQPLLERRGREVEGERRGLLDRGGDLGQERAIGRDRRLGRCMLFRRGCGRLEAEMFARREHGGGVERLPARVRRLGDDAVQSRSGQDADRLRVGDDHDQGAPVRRDGRRGSGELPCRTPSRLSRPALDRSDRHRLQ